jgi:hypothetical protein
MPDADYERWHNPDGSIKYCEAPYPKDTTRGGTRPQVLCYQIIGHKGDHKNGTWIWPEHSDREQHDG